MNQQSLQKSLKGSSNSQAEGQSHQPQWSEKNENVPSLKLSSFMQFPGSCCISWLRIFLHHPISCSTTRYWTCCYLQQWCAQGRELPEFSRPLLSDEATRSWKGNESKLTSLADSCIIKICGSWLDTKIRLSTQQEGKATETWQMTKNYFPP